MMTFILRMSGSECPLIPHGLIEGPECPKRRPSSRGLFSIASVEVGLPSSHPPRGCQRDLGMHLGGQRRSRSRLHHYCQLALSKAAATIAIREATARTITGSPPEDNQPKTQKNNAEDKK